MKCIKCGENTGESFAFCPRCGSPAELTGFEKPESEDAQFFQSEVSVQNEEEDSDIPYAPPKDGYGFFDSSRAVLEAAPIASVPTAPSESPMTIHGPSYESEVKKRPAKRKALRLVMVASACIVILGIVVFLAYKPILFSVAPKVYAKISLSQLMGTVGSDMEKIRKGFGGDMLEKRNAGTVSSNIHFGITDIPNVTNETNDLIKKFRIDAESLSNIAGKKSSFSFGMAWDEAKLRIDGYADTSGVTLAMPDILADVYKLEWKDFVKNYNASHWADRIGKIDSDVNVDSEGLFLSDADVKSDRDVSNRTFQREFSKLIDSATSEKESRQKLAGFEGELNRVKLTLPDKAVKDFIANMGDAAKKINSARMTQLYDQILNALQKDAGLSSRKAEISYTDGILSFYTNNNHNLVAVALDMTITRDGAEQPVQLVFGFPGEKISLNDIYLSIHMDSLGAELVFDGDLLFENDKCDGELTAKIFIHDIETEKVVFSFDWEKTKSENNLIFRLDVTSPDLGTLASIKATGNYRINETEKITDFSLKFLDIKDGTMTKTSVGIDFSVKTSAANEEIKDISAQAKDILQVDPDALGAELEEGFETLLQKFDQFFGLSTDVVSDQDDN